ncbi:MAG: metallophosphoesterase [Clostridia bacterium]|nr:metallophosphoesterase [Clostridia bacterium]
MDRTRKKKKPPFLLRLLKKVFQLVLVVLGLAVYMTRIEPSWVQVTELDIAGQVEGSLTAVAFGDTHIGMGKDVEELEELVAQINDLQPDAVFFLGDLFDNYGAYTGDVEGCLSILADIQAEYKYAVRGNHDVGGGAEFLFPDWMESAGFVLLENACAELPGGIRLIGAANATYYTPNVEEMTGEGFDLLLSHEPDVADSISNVELQLSGHSHGGQVYLPFLVDRILPRGAQTYFRGYYEKDDGGTIYVNRGVGMSMLPVRFFSRPEITFLTIHGE